MKTRWLIAVFVLVLCSSVFAEDMVSGRFVDINGNVQTGECIKDGICASGCLEGDSDCTCSEQKGFVCSANEECVDNLLKNWGDVVCCSNVCKSSSLLNGSGNIQEIASSGKTEVIGSTKVNSEKPETKTSYPLGILVALITLILIVIYYGIRHPKK